MVHSSKLFSSMNLNRQKTTGNRHGTPFNTFPFSRMQGENQNSRLAEIPSMKNKAGRKEQNCRVGGPVGDNQHQIRTAEVEVMHDVSLQVEPLKVGQEIVDSI